MTDPKKRDRRVSPLAALGGLVMTLRAEEAVRIEVGTGIFISIDHHPRSSSCFRVRVIGDRSIGVKRMNEDEVALLIRAFQGAYSS